MQDRRCRWGKWLVAVARRGPPWRPPPKVVDASPVRDSRPSPGSNQERDPRRNRPVRGASTHESQPGIGIR